jgi:hypothetical protein
MKRTIYILFVSAGLIISSCSKEEVNPKLSGPESSSVEEVSATRVEDVDDDNDSDVKDSDGLYIVRIPQKEHKSKDNKEKTKSNGGN